VNRALSALHGGSLEITHTVQFAKFKMLRTGGVTLMLPWLKWTKIWNVKFQVFFRRLLERFAAHLFIIIVLHILPFDVYLKQFFHDFSLTMSSSAKSMMFKVWWILSKVWCLIMSDVWYLIMSDVWCLIT